MQYVLLIYESPENFDDRSTGPAQPYISAWRTYYQAMVEADVYVGGNPLQGVDTADTVRVKSGRRQVQDGPYAETKEHLGGFIIIEVPSREAAMEWAARCPVAATGSVEVRPVAAELHQTIVDPSAGEAGEPQSR